MGGCQSVGFAVVKTCGIEHLLAAVAACVLMKMLLECSITLPPSPPKKGGGEGGVTPKQSE